MNSVFLYIIELVLLISVVSSSINVQSSNNDSTDGSSKTPRASLEIGPFKIETFYNETNLKEKLRLGKSYFKLKILDKFSPDNLYFTIKLSRLEELLPCDNLTFESKLRDKNQDVQQILDCQPIEAFLMNNNNNNNNNNGNPSPSFSDNSSSSGGGAGYVRRSSLRLKEKLPKPLPNIFHEHHLYPLKKEPVEVAINLLAEKHNLTALDFTDLRVDLGYYFESIKKEHKGDVDPLICSGLAFLSINRTGILARYSHDPYPEFLDEMSHFMEQGSENGYLLSLQDVNCAKANYGSLFGLGLHSSFTIIQRLKFPYLVVEHTMDTRPLDSMFNYVANVDQKLVPEMGPSAYNTTVHIKSRSILFDLLNFNLNQVFENLDLETGKEKMTMTTGGGTITVESAWTALTAAKRLVVSSIASVLYNSKDIKFSTLKELMSLSYFNEGDSDDYVVMFKFKKNLIEGNPFNTLVESLTQATKLTEEPSKMSFTLSDEL